MIGIWVEQSIQSHNTLLCLRACSMRARHAVASLLSFKFFRRPESHKAQLSRRDLCKLEEKTQLPWETTTWVNMRLDIRNTLTTQSGKPNKRPSQLPINWRAYPILTLGSESSMDIGFTSSWVSQRQPGILSYILLRGDCWLLSVLNSRLYIHIQMGLSKNRDTSNFL